MIGSQELPLLFISYSHEDGAYKDQVLKHLNVLARQGKLEPWHDQLIGAGEDWYQDIEEKLVGCAVAVLLISANFLSSKFCMQAEVPILLERRRRECMMILPILVENCHWQAVPWLRAIQMRPGDGGAIEALNKPKRNAAFAKITEEIALFLQSDAAFSAVASRNTIIRQFTTAGGDENILTDTLDPKNAIIYSSRVQSRLRHGLKEEGPPMRYAEQPAGAQVDLNRLPTSGMEVVGRDEELRLLNEAAESRELNIISFAAWGGVGKSTLLNKWCEYLKNNNFSEFDFIYAWSFHSQGSSGQITSSDTFADEALRFFGEVKNEDISHWAKGSRLAEIVGSRNTLLILDGIEPLQDEDGRIADPALASLVHGLAENNKGLCLITTRKPIHDLQYFPRTTTERNLEQLSVAAGRAYLRIGGVCGSDSELEAARAVSNHMESRGIPIQLII